jgi:hypothetical protein
MADIQQLQNLQEQLNQQFRLNDPSSQVNRMVTQSADALTCGPNCQKTREAERLKQAYLDAKANVSTSPTQLNEAAKNYYTYTQGTAGYNRYLAAQVSSQASATSSATASTFADALGSAADLTDTYAKLYTSYENAFDLYEKYLIENSELQGSIDMINTDTVTSDRKSFYESQGLDGLNNWNTVLKWIYIIMVCIYIFGLLLAKSSYNFMSRFLILISFIVYPFIITYIVITIYTWVSKIGALIPKNVYISN